MTSTISGKVYLVGAGPGDPGLFTIKGRDLLSKAQVVIYDYLANEELLSLAPAKAETIYVGKKGGDHTLSQDEINRLLVEKGRRYRVVRLKGGDPFVFGRGGEEAEVLQAAGIPFEVVPGVTAAVAVPAYAGIPLSHRDLTATIGFVTGHERADSERSKIDWKGLATSVGTLVFFMGVKNLRRICSRLCHEGRSPATPVAVIRWGTTSRQRTVTGNLEDIADRVEEAGLKPPAIIVVGKVVRLRDTLNWFEKRPLFGRSVIVTRARQQASEFRQRLQALGAHCIEFPTIEIVPPPSWEALDQALEQLESYHWIIFTSVNGVRYFMRRLLEKGRDVRDLKGIKLAAIGPKTAEAVRGYGFRLDLVPTEYRAEALLEGLRHECLADRRFLLPRAMRAREVLPETLRAHGARVDVPAAYQTVLPQERAETVAAMLEEGQIDCITFTSSSTVENFFELIGPRPLREGKKPVNIACIGPITAETVVKHGFRVDIMAAEYTMDGLLKAVQDHFTLGR